MHHIPKLYEGYWIPTPFARFPFTSRPVRHRVPSHFNWSLPLKLPRITGCFTLTKLSCVVRLVSWDLTPRRLADKYQSFRGIGCPEDEGSKCLWNVAAFYDTTCPYITGDFSRRTQHCENLKFRTTVVRLEWQTLFHVSIHMRHTDKYSSKILCL